MLRYLPFLFLLIGLPCLVLAEEDEDESVEELKRILPATAAEEGALEVSIIQEHSRLNFDYAGLDSRGEETDFIADDFFTWKTELQIDVGIMEDVEAGLVVPLIYASFEAAGRDKSTARRSIDDYGIGEVELYLSYGFESDDETLFALISFGVELPSNTLDKFFGGRTTAWIGSIEVEKYFGNVGIVGGIESTFEDELWCHEYQAGIGFIPNDKSFGQIFFARTPEDGINRVEGTFEYLVTEALSLEWLLSHEFSGDDEETIAGFGLTVFFGE